jgi:hypothetical protein
MWFAMCRRQATGLFNHARNHLKNANSGQSDTELVTLLGTLALVLCGAGPYFLDARMGRENNP